MASVFVRDGIVIHVFPNDHEPKHCHVFYKGSEYRVYFDGWVFEYKSGKKLNAPILRKILEVIMQGRNEIGKEWRKFHGN